MLLLQIFGVLGFALLMAPNLDFVVREQRRRSRRALRECPQPDLRLSQRVTRAINVKGGS